jgi:hypothetical protein
MKYHDKETYQNKLNVMKKTAKLALIGLIFASAAGFTAPAEARGYDSRGHHGYYGGHRGYRHHGYRHHGYRHRSHSSHRGAYLAGGLIIGSLLTHAYHRNNQPYVNEGFVRETRVVSEPRIVSRSTGRRLFRDRNGDCFERTTTRNGDELLLELDPNECAW